MSQGFLSNKRYECCRVSGMSGSLLPAAMMKFALPVLIGRSAFSAALRIRVSGSRGRPFAHQALPFVTAGNTPLETYYFLLKQRMLLLQNHPVCAK